MNETKEIPLDAWAAAKFSPPPSIHTLRRWVRERRIQPAPYKYGRMYYVIETARDTGISRTRRRKAPPSPPLGAYLGFRILPLDQLRGLPQVSKLATAPGLYFLWRGSTLFYVGQSVDVGTRVAQHRLLKRFTRATWLRTRPDCLRIFERKYINKYSPPDNISLWR